MSASDTESERKGRAEVRDRLLRAARARFARQGFEATTMQQIVQDAGTSIGNCYFYFHDKEDLMVAVIRAVSEEIERAIDAQMARAPSGPGRMAAALYFGVEAALARADIVRQVLVGASYPALRHIIHEIYAGRVRRFFEANPALLGDHDLDLAVYAWNGANFSVLEKALAGEVAPDAAALGRFLTRWNVRALGLAPDAIDVALASLDTVIESAALDAVQ